MVASKRLAGGGFRAEKRHYELTRKVELGAEVVDWGGTSKRTENPWVTADALGVLHRAGAS